MYTNQFPRGISSVTNLFVAVILGLSAFLSPASAAVAAPTHAPLAETLTGSISGHVYEVGSSTPVTNADVHVKLNNANDIIATTQTDDQGYYTVNVPPSNNYKIDVWADGYLRAYYSDAARWSQATPVPVVASQTISGIDIHLIKADSYITGRTTYENGSPAANVWMEAFHEDGWFVGISANENGEFTIPVIGGTWQVFPYAPPLVANQQDIAVNTGETVNNVNFVLHPSGSISGYVRQANGVTPISGAKVYAMDTDFQYINDGYSESDGSYQITGLTSGTYYVAVEASGYGWVYYDNGYDDDSATLVTVTVSDDKPDINFQLSPEATISGHVYQSDGVTPIAGVEVYVSPKNGGEFRSATTNADGSYTVGGLSTGNYVARVNANGYAQEYYNNAYSRGTATPIAVAQPNNRSGIDFTLELGGDISGHIYETDGVTPVANAQVVIFINDVSQSITDVTADEQGYYIFNGIATGNNYKIHARADGYLRAFHPDVASWGDAAWISVQAGQTTSGKDIKLIKADSYITGRTTYEDGSPAANAWMEAFHEDGWFVGINANENGEFSIPVIAGDWRIFPHDLPMAAVEQSVLVTTGATVSGINFILHPTGSISGVVYQSDGTTPIGNMALSLITATQEEGGWACSDANGQFTFEDVPYRVQWRVSAVPSWRCTGQPEGYKHEYWQDTNSWDDAAVITLSESMPNYDTINFSLEAGQTASGTVGAGGGEVSTPSNNISIEVPKDAISEDTAFTITDGGDEYQIATDTGGLDVVMSTTIGPEGTTFASPATLTFQWLDSDDNGIVDGTTFNEDDLYLSKDGVVIAGPCSTDTKCDKITNKFTVEVNSLSEFVIGVPLVCYTLTLGHTGSGSNPIASPANTTGCPSGSYIEGESISLSDAVPGSGWQISSWTGTANNASTANTNSLVMPAGNSSVNVNYLVQRAKNGGFNTYSGTSKIPKYWVKSTNFASTDGKDTSTKKEGAASVRIAGAKGKVKTLTQTLSLSGAKGQSFAFSYWVKGSAMPTKGSCYGQVLFYYGSTLKGTKTLKCPTGATYTWKQVTLKLTAPAAYNKVLIKFTYSKASGKVWFDLVSLLR